MLSVLFDLDDTLITNNAESFTRVYLEILGKHLQSYIKPEIMIPALLEGTRRMVIKQELAGTLEDTFDAYFYPEIQISKDAIKKQIDEFYTENFAVLKDETLPRPDAVALVKECFNRGWNVAVATNPLFPAAAVHHRLDWAGLNSGQYPFAAITSYETYHFAKPNPAFFSEVAARISTGDHPVVVIGNDLKDDIIPAGKAGFPTFWLTESNQTLPEDLPAGSACGEMKDILPWLEKMEVEWNPKTKQTKSALLSGLRGGAAAIEAIAHATPCSQWAVRPGESEWCVTEILCHLRDLDREINLVRVKTILQGAQPFIAGVETDRWCEERDYIHQNGMKALEQFFITRQELIDCLESAPETEWNRVIRHSIFGPTTLKELVGFINAHDINHIRQIKNQLT